MSIKTHYKEIFNFMNNNKAQTMCPINLDVFKKSVHAVEDFNIELKYNQNQLWKETVIFFKDDKIVAAAQQNKTSKLWTGYAYSSVFETYDDLEADCAPVEEVFSEMGELRDNLQNCLNIWNVE
jgi:hypothetical protein